MRTRNNSRRLIVNLVAATLLSAGCASEKSAKSGANAKPVAKPPVNDAINVKVDRLAFNKAGARLDLPVFWMVDKNDPGLMNVDEVAFLHGHDTNGATYIRGGGFTQAMLDAVASIETLKPVVTGGSVMPGSDAQRKGIVAMELEQGRPTLVYNDFSAGTDEDKAIVHHILNAAKIIERIYAKQLGTDTVAETIAPEDKASRALLRRNQAPWCVAPKTESVEGCHATKEKPKRIYGLYPAALQEDPKFCEKLGKHKNTKELLAPFNTVALDDKGALTSVPYHEAFPEEMNAIATELEKAASAITDPSEVAFKAYLTADAEAFRTNLWEPADEAWSKMNVHNSKWYLRLAPDEVYYDPCNRKAGFHVSFARINKDSLEWQKKLEPVKSEMEGALAKLAGAPYKARDVSFHLPDFIDIVLNAGNARAPYGATVGQSLPNWGPVANEGRGRTVAMTNLYTDEDSIQNRRVQLESLFCADTKADINYDPRLGTMSTVFHEAAHNLGPAHEYKVKGKTDDEIFGGPLASMMEELKSQTAALYFAEWLKDKGILDNETAKQAHVRDISWMFGHISRGMYTADGKPKAYSQLAAIQLAYFMKEKAVEWRAEELAINGKDKGCLFVDVAKMPESIDALAKTVLRIKGSGDKKGALALKKEFVDTDGEYSALRAIITERLLRSEKATFVYSIKQ